MSLYGYGGSSPAAETDPFGLASTKTLRRRIQRAYGWGDWWPVDEEGKPYQIDHIIPKSEGGTDDLDNLRVISRKDHIARHRAEGHFQKWGKKGAAARAARRAFGAAGVLAFMNIQGAHARGVELSKKLMLLFQQLSRTTDYWTAYSIALEIALLLAEESGWYGYNNAEEIMEAWSQYRAWARENRQPSESGDQSPTPDPTFSQPETGATNNSSRTPCFGLWR